MMKRTLSSAVAPAGMPKPGLAETPVTNAGKSNWYFHTFRALSGVELLIRVRHYGRPH